MRYLTLFCIVAAALCTSAQTTLSDNVIPKVGDVWGYHDTPYIGPGNAGMGVKWDFRSLPNGVLVPYRWSDAAVAPGAGAFPNNVIVSEIPGEPTAYYEVGDTAFYWLGTYSDNALVRFDPPLVMLDLPCSINTQWVSIGVAAVTGAGRIEMRNTTLNARAESWGTLLMPYGEVNNVIRIRYDLKLTTHKDPTSIIMSEVRYAWYTDQCAMPLLVISERSGWPPPERTVRWLDGTWRDGPNRLFQPIKLMAFPDPCDEIATIDLPATKADRTILQLIDGEGNVAKQWIAEFNSPQTRRLTLQMNDVPSGSYTLTWIGTDGTIGSTRLTRR